MVAQDNAHTVPASLLVMSNNSCSRSQQSALDLSEKLLKTRLEWHET